MGHRNALSLVLSNQAVDLFKKSVTLAISSLTLNAEISDNHSAPTVQQHFGTIIACLLERLLKHKLSVRCDLLKTNSEC